jgi:hypothetical protein
MSSLAPIYRENVKEADRGQHTAARFGVRFLWLESYIYDSAASLCADYDGGFWEFYALSNGGFYQAPRSDRIFRVACANGFDGQLSADAFGITACLYAYSLLSFSADKEFAAVCAQQYHCLRDYAALHPEAAAIWRATD